jgi:hypothetical protein
MMSPWLALAGLVALGLATPAPGAAKPRATPRPKLATAVNLENQRNISLLSFEVVMLGQDTPSKDTPSKDTPSKDLPDKDKTPETIVAKLEKPLGAGESASLKLTGAKGCLFEARWKFADVDDSGSVDLCNDARIVLVD